MALCSTHASLRVRLTFWYATALALVLGLFAAGAYQLLRQGLYREIDRQLESDYKVADELMESAGKMGELVPRQAATLEPAGNWRWREIWGLDVHFSSSALTEPCDAARIPTMVNGVKSN